MKHKVKLSQCMIVKNEEDNIERALSWGKGVVCEQIVVDTGSTDRTIEIAEKMGAKIFHFDWIDDFSAAKNYAIEQSSGRWIAFLDADEYFTPKDARKLVNLLNEIETRKSIAEWPHIIRTTLANLDDEGRIFSMMVQDRIFRNMPSVRYENKIHEYITLKGDKDPRIADARKILTILHTGYSNSVFEKTEKAKRNIELLQRELKEHPDDYNLMTSLGDVYLIESRYNEAIEIFQRIINEAPGKENVIPYAIENSCNQLMKFLVGNPPSDGKALDYWYQKCIEAVPQLPDIDYWYAIRMMNLERWEETFQYMQKALDKLEKYHGDVVLNITGDLPRVYCILSRAAQEIRDDVSAVKYMVLALRMNRFEESVLVALLDILKKDPAERESGEGTFLLLNKIYHFDGIKDKLFVLKCAKLSGFLRMEEKVMNLFTDKEREGLIG